MSVLLGIERRDRVRQFIILVLDTLTKYRNDWYSLDVRIRYADYSALRSVSRHVEKSLRLSSGLTVVMCNCIKWYTTVLQF